MDAESNNGPARALPKAMLCAETHATYLNGSKGALPLEWIVVMLWNKAPCGGNAANGGNHPFGANIGGL